MFIKQSRNYIYKSKCDFFVILLKETPLTSEMTSNRSTGATSGENYPYYKNNVIHYSFPNTEIIDELEMVQGWEDE